MNIIELALSNYQKSLLDSSSSSVNQSCTIQECDENVILTTPKAVTNLVDMLCHHNSKCNETVSFVLEKNDGCSLHYKLRCDICTYNSVWRTSLELPENRDLINLKVTHAFLCSGMLPSQVERFCDCIGVSTLYKRKQNEYVEEYSKHVHSERISSCETALAEELSVHNSVDIITDARHSTRRNSKYTDIVCIGYNTHKVLDHEVIRREDDSCSQRHELHGTKRIYENFDTKGVHVRRHGHDRNASVNKFVREQRKSTVNQNDTWHVSVSVEKELKKISSGAKCREGKTWSVQLADKVQPVKTHIQFAMRSCNGDASKLRSNIENIVDHYQNKHSNCDMNSRCRKDSNYIPSRVILTDSNAVNLLSNALRSTDVYRHPECYVHHMDTFFVESFNNVLNIFQDKRIGTFGDLHYKLRSNLAICHWNENVKRKTNSFQYRKNIWSRCISSLFSGSVWRPY